MLQAQSSDGAVAAVEGPRFPSSMQLTFMSPITLTIVRQRSRNQSTVSSSATYSDGQARRP